MPEPETMPQSAPEVAVAIPVRNEAALIGDCLRALALQDGDVHPDIVLLVNNSTDGTAAIARELRPALPCRVHIVEHEFPQSQANAGHARRMAMSKAAMLVAPGGVVMTTDADSCVAPDWIEANLAALDAGVDVVCGRAIIDPVDALRIPRALHDDDKRETDYGARLDRIASLLDPSADDPWPRHTEESGASIAVRREVFMAAGGVPPVRHGEDRALIDALRRVDARIRHDPAITVSVSGRIEGRAAGGMADTIRRRILCQDPMLDDTLEPVVDRVRRIGARRLLRLAWMRSAGRHRVVRHLATELELSETQIDGWLALPYFGASWALVSAASPVLARHLVPRSELSHQMQLAAEILGSLAGSHVPIHRAAR
jgi:GT2 family glycosyltransferase